MARTVLKEPEWKCVALSVSYRGFKTKLGLFEVPELDEDNLLPSRQF